MPTDDELDIVIELAARWTAVDPAFHPAAPVGDLLRRAANGTLPTPSAELAAVLAGQRLADHELSPGAARASRIARRYLPAVWTQGRSHRRWRSPWPGSRR